MENPLVQLQSQFNTQNTFAQSFENQETEHYQEEEEYEQSVEYFEDSDEEDLQEEGDEFDFAIRNQVMKTKKFKLAKVSQQSEDLSADEDEEESSANTNGRTIFKGADKIFHQILWDEKLDKNEFIVAYEDRFEGIIEEPFSVFETLKEDIPFHRIRYFKKNGEIVWDRKKKINTL